MEKVTITKEQAESIEKFLDNANPSRASLLQLHATGEWMGLHYKSLNLLSVDEMARALYIGYEIEKQKFQPGDAAINCRSGVFSRLTEQTADFVNTEYIFKDELRHATLEEIYWMETLGRERVGDFRIGDIVLNKLLHPYVVRKETDGATRVSRDKAYEMYKDEKLFSIYPASSEKEISKESES